MRYIWEEKDIHCGLRVLNSSANDEYIIGYDSMMDVRYKDTKYCIVSLSDGGTYAWGKSYIQIASILTSGNFIPKTISNKVKEVS